MMRFDILFIILTHKRKEAYWTQDIKSTRKRIGQQRG